MKDFKKYYSIPATPEYVYLALTNELTLQLWTGDKAEMTAVPGSEFSLWDGAIVGKNLEFEENKKDRSAMVLRRPAGRIDRHDKATRNRRGGYIGRAPAYQHSRCRLRRYCRWLEYDLFRRTAGFLPGIIHARTATAIRAQICIAAIRAALLPSRYWYSVIAK